MKPLRKITPGPTLRLMLVRFRLSADVPARVRQMPLGLWRVFPNKLRDLVKTAAIEARYNMEGWAIRSLGSNIDPSVLEAMRCA